MARMLVLTLVLVSSVSFAADKKQAPAAPAKSEARKPASGSCQSGSIDMVPQYAQACAAGKWMASGDAVSSTVCCIETEENIPQAR